MALDSAAFKQRFSKAKQNRQLWNSQLDEAYDLFLPNRQTITTRSKGDERFNTIYDPIGVSSLQEFANNIKSKLLPSYQEWAAIKPAGIVEAEVAQGIATAESRDELARTMNVINRTIFQYIWSSNFDQSAHESIQDMAVSTGALLLLDNNSVDSPLNFVSVPANQLYPESTETIFREHNIKAREIEKLFPKAEADKAITELMRDNPDKNVCVIEGTIENNQTKKFDYCVYIEEADRKIYFSDEYTVSPWIVFRWNVAPGEVMGRGPAINALPSMRILNKLVAQLIYNNDMAITPPVMMDSNSSLLDMSNVAVVPGSILPFEGNYDGSRSPFQYLETRANFNVGENMRSEYHNQIRNMFHLPMLGQITDPTKSATEINIRNQQALAQQSSAFGRLQQELVSKVIKRAHFILSSYNIVPKELEIDGKVATVKATSPLAKVQDAADLEGLMTYIQTAMSFGEMGSAMIGSTLDTGQLGNYLADKMGVPAMLKLSSEQQKLAQEQIAAVAAQQAGIQQ